MRRLASLMVLLLASGCSIDSTPPPSTHETIALVPESIELRDRPVGAPAKPSLPETVELRELPFADPLLRERFLRADAIARLGVHVVGRAKAAVFYGGDDGAVGAERHSSRKSLARVQISRLRPP